MFKIGDYIVFKPDLLIGHKYGTVTYSGYLHDFKDCMLQVVRITSAGTAECRIVTSPNSYQLNSNRCKTIGTIHELMVNKSKFRDSDECYLNSKYLYDAVKWNGFPQQLAEKLDGTKFKIIQVDYHHKVGFRYKISCLNESLNKELSSISSTVWKEELLLTEQEFNNEYEDRLQEQKVADSGGESYEGCGVHGESLQSKISIGRLSDSKGIRGS